MLKENGDGGNYGEKPAKRLRTGDASENGNENGDFVVGILFCVCVHVFSNLTYTTYFLNQCAN